MPRMNPGYHSIELGDITVTALNDGQFQASTELVKGPSPQESEALLRDSFRVVPPRITVSCFLLETPAGKALVDFGAGGFYGQALGKAASWLHALDVAPDSIGTILLTHGHVDHVGGLLDGQGASVFPRAELVVNGAEVVHWTAQPAPEGGDAARRVFEIYGNRLRRAAHGEEVLPGVTLHQMAGHTPGHSGFMIQSGGESLLLWGDTVNLPAIFFARPDAFLGFDSDPNQARETRRRMFDMVATDKLLVAGNHHDFPLFGHLLKHGDGYAWEPMVWAPSAAGLAA